MKIVCLFGRTRCEENTAPELLVAWDEYTLDCNPEGFEADCEKAKKSYGGDLVASRIVEIEVDEEELSALFAPANLKGKIT